MLQSAIVVLSLGCCLVHSGGKLCELRNKHMVRKPCRRDAADGGRFACRMYQKGAGSDTTALFSHTDNSVVDEASTALVLLGFTKANVNKAIAAVLKESPGANLESIIKSALKKL